MAIYQTRNCICAVQWDPEDKQSLENIKALVKDNPRLGWKVNDNILSNKVLCCSVRTTLSATLMKFIFP